MARPDHLLAYFGHHKSASTWIHNIVGNVCDETGMQCAYLANPEMFDGDLPAYVEGHDVDFLCYVNANQEHLAGLPEFRGFHMIRDPRDILASAYFSHLHSHKTAAWPALVEHRAKLMSVDKAEGLLLEMEFNADVFEDMRSWNYEQPNVLELKMEEFTVDPLNGFIDVFRFLGILDETHHGKKAQARFLMTSAANVISRHSKLPVGRSMASLPAERLLGIVHNNRFETKTGGRDAGKENVKSHYRKGMAGDWVNHFEPQHVKAFKQRYNDLLLRLGYESDPDWDAGLFD
jgi:hypothetical protein